MVCTDYTLLIFFASFPFDIHGHAHVHLLRTAYAQNPLLNAHVEVSSVARCLHVNSGQSTHIVYSSSKVFRLAPVSYVIFLVKLIISLRQQFINFTWKLKFSAWTSVNLTIREDGILDDFFHSEILL